jgi:hypothetical protein
LTFNEDLDIEEFLDWIGEYDRDQLYALSNGIRSGWLFFFMDKDDRNSLHDGGMKAFLALYRLISKN